jgi:hypothetical protein
MPTHTWGYQAKTQFFELLQIVMGIMNDGSRESLIPNHGYKAGTKFVAR